MFTMESQTKSQLPNPRQCVFLQDVHLWNDFDRWQALAVEDEKLESESRYR